MTSLAEATRPGRQSTWTDEKDEMLVQRRDIERMRWNDIAFVLGMSKSACHRRYGELSPKVAPSIVPDQEPRRRPLHVRLGISTHVHRQAILDDSRKGMWDEQERVWAHHHRYRESVTLAGAA